MPDRSRILSNMNKLSSEKRAAAVRCFVDGVSVRGTCRITGVSKGTVLTLLADLGDVCWQYQHETLRNLPCKKIQADEIWSFVGSKEKNTKPEKKADGWGDAWTWTTICADCKLIPSWIVGPRDAQTGTELMTDLAARLANRVQLTTDGHKAYLEAVETAFGSDIDYAMLVKLYGAPEGASKTERKYSPGECCGTRTDAICGTPEPSHVSTSFAERANLTIRMNMRRFTRLTNAFSKKIENLHHALSINFFFYNFIRIHQTLRVTPAMEAGVETKLWTVEMLIALLEAREPDAKAVGAKRKDRRS